MKKVLALCLFGILSNQASGNCDLVSGVFIPVQNSSPASIRCSPVFPNDQGNSYAWGDQDDPIQLDACRSEMSAITEHRFRDEDRVLRTVLKNQLIYSPQRIADRGRFHSFRYSTNMEGGRAFEVGSFIRIKKRGSLIGYEYDMKWTLVDEDTITMQGKYRAGHPSTPPRDCTYVRQSL